MIPAIVPALVSILGWVGIDLGISWLTREQSEVVYAMGMGPQEFLDTHWLPLLLYLLMAASAVSLALPKRRKNDGRAAP